MKHLKLALVGTILATLTVSGLWASKAVSTAHQDIVAAQVGLKSAAVDKAIQDLSEQSEFIITGRCIGTKSAWVQDDRALVTLATVSVDEAVKGAAPSEVTVVLPGGVDANRRIPIAMTYAGAPQITAQEEVFLFLTPEESVHGGFAVTGFAEGKFSIVEDETGRKMVSRDPMKGKVKNGAGTVRGSIQATPLSEFKDKVRGYLLRQ